MGAKRLGKYELLRHLATGGMARVYLARVEGVGGFARHLVLKTVRPERTEDTSYVAMFLDEARLIATLHHQHVAQVYDVGVGDDGTYFLAMEYLHGETVRAILERARDRRERLPLDFSLTVVAAAAAGLHHAHERRGPDGRPLGIVHRDVTPSNVIAGYDGSVKLIDFGIAKAAERSTQTKTGFIKGKAGYMAPEQALGHPVDRRADVFSLGVMLYELTTQTRAFPASSELEVAHRIVRGEVTPPSVVVTGYPSELEDVILTALARDPDERFGDADAFGYALDRAAAQLGVSTSPAAVSRVLAQLFGSRPEPWLVQAEDAPVEHTTKTGDTASLLDSRPLLVTTGNASSSNSALAFARGTGAQGSSDANLASASAPLVSPARTPTIPPPMRGSSAVPVPVDSGDDALDDDADEMPTVKFLALDEAEIIIEGMPPRGPKVPPGSSAPVVAATAPAVGSAAAPSTSTPSLTPTPKPAHSPALTPRPVMPAMTPRPGRSSSPLPGVGEARALGPIPQARPLIPLRLGPIPQPRIESSPTLVPMGSPLPEALPSRPTPPNLMQPVAPPGAQPAMQAAAHPGLVMPPPRPAPLLLTPAPPMAPSPLVPPLVASLQPRASSATAPPLPRMANGSQPPPFPSVASVLAPSPSPSPLYGAAGPFGGRTEQVTALAQLTAKTSRRWILPLAGGAVTAAVVIALAIEFLGGGASPAESPAASEPDLAAPMPAPTTAPAVPPVAPPAPPVADKIIIRVTTTPADATVLLDGERLGHSPIVLDRPRGTGKVFLKVRKKGYSARKIEVDLAGDITWDIRLPPAP